MIALQSSPEAGRLMVTDRRALRFDAPFGEGADRHTGVRAASAIVPYAGGWLIAQDDSSFAAHWTPSGTTPIRLFPRGAADTYSEARGNKADKPDLESGTVIPTDDGPLAVFFGSGSTERRMRAAVVTERGGALESRVVALDHLYAAALAALQIGPGELNLEAACTVGDRVRFFQRGNGAAGVNASFDVEARALVGALRGDASLGPDHVINVRRYELGSLGGVPLGFSAAAVLADGSVLFAAAAEDSPSTYDDGACAGSVIGLLGPDQSLLARWPVKPDAGIKIEGLAVERSDGRRIELLAVTDPDDPTRPSEALRLQLDL